MAHKPAWHTKETDRLFEAVLTLDSLEECYAFFEDLCTMKELSDMSQRLQAAEMLLNGDTYEKVVKQVGISTATISRINRCIQYGSGGYASVVSKLPPK